MAIFLVVPFWANCLAVCDSKISGNSLSGLFVQGPFRTKFIDTIFVYVRVGGSVILNLQGRLWSIEY